MEKFNFKNAGPSYFIGLSIFAIAVLCFMIYTIIITGKLISEHNVLESKGNASLATVVHKAQGYHSNFIIYQFFNKNKALVTKKEEVGRTIQGKRLKDIKIGDKIEINYFDNISRIRGNYKIFLWRNILFLIFFFLLFFLSLASIIKVYFLKKSQN